MALDPKTKILALNFSIRTSNALVKNGINTVEDLLVFLSFNDLTSLKGIGIKGANEISELLDNISDPAIDESILDDFVPVHTIGSSLRNIPHITDRDCQILKDYYSEKKENTQRLSEKFNISRARVHQIIVKKTNQLFKIFQSGMIDPEIIASLNDYAYKRSEIHTIEIRDPIFTGSGIAYLIASFKPSPYKIFTRNYLNGKWFLTADDHLEEILDSLYEKLRYDNEPLKIEDIKAYYSIDEDMLMSIKGIITKDGYITHEHNRQVTGSDRNYLITTFLEKINRPSTINEISQYTGLTDNQVRGALCNKNLYINVSRSTYDLIDRHYDELSIEKLISNFLTARNCALKINEILAYIRKYKSASDRDIYNCILNSKNFYRTNEFILLKEWDNSKIVKKEMPKYQTKLEDAVLEIINASDEIFNADKVLAKLKEYKSTVSTNPYSVKAALLSLADKHYINRVGKLGTGCYTRNQNFP